MWVVSRGTAKTASSVIVTTSSGCASSIAIRQVMSLVMLAGYIFLSGFFW